MNTDEGPQLETANFCFPDNLKMPSNFEYDIQLGITGTHLLVTTLF